MEDEIDLREYIDVILRKWKIIVVFVIALTVCAFLYAKSQKPVYESSVSILFRTASSSSLSQYAGLASMVGINFSGGGGSSGDLMELLKSKAVAFKVLDDLKLTKRIKGWDNPGIERDSLASAVKGMIKPPKASGSIYEIKAESDDPQLAADIANDYVQALAFYWNELNYSEAQKKLKYIQEELPRVESELKIVEGKLKLSPRSASGFSFGGSIGVSGIQRDYEIYNSVYTMLRKELESTKLEASKEIPPFSVIDKAVKPDSPIKPKIKLNTMIGFVLGLFIGIFVAFFQEYWEKSGGRGK